MRALSALLCGAMLAGCGGSALAPSTPRAANGAIPDAHRGFHELYRFYGEGRGKHPTGRLILVNGVAYGITRRAGRGPTFSGGVVFSFTPAAGEQILHTFGGGTKDGEDPSSLIYADGKFYGTTFGGGAHRHGTVFSLSLSGSEQILYSFAGGTDGDSPNDLVAVKHKLYGTTETGGAYTYYGTLFEATASGKETILHSFSGPPDGAGPSGRLVFDGSRIYGTTGLGGVTGNCYVEGCGTIFSVTTAGVEQTVYDFQGGTDGYFPIDLVMLDGTIYGETMERGTDNLGTVFAMTASGVRVVRAFQPGDGYEPQGLSGINHSLYGTLAFGNGGGSLFELTPSGELTQLHHFYGRHGGIWPAGDLIDVGGTLEGETVYGGDAHNEGTIYSYAL